MNCHYQRPGDAKVQSSFGRHFTLTVVCRLDITRVYHICLEEEGGGKRRIWMFIKGEFKEKDLFVAN